MADETKKYSVQKINLLKKQAEGINPAKFN